MFATTVQAELNAKLHVWESGLQANYIVVFNYMLVCHKF